MFTLVPLRKIEKRIHFICFKIFKIKQRITLFEVRTSEEDADHTLFVFKHRKQQKRLNIICSETQETHAICVKKAKRKSKPFFVLKIL